MEFDNYIQAAIDNECIHLELQSNYPFYRKLSAELQQRFLSRVSNFIEQKKFVARQYLELTDKIRIIISACAVQVTLGLDGYLLESFEFIVLYPDVYQSPITHKMHKGETNLNGFICLSWKHILEGIEKPDDNYNLGLHEWTHALRFNGIKFQETDYFFDNYINKWVASATHEFSLLKNGNTSIFRKYGAANIHEFLSVTVEHFFESTEEFREKASALYVQMCILLNQEPNSVSSTSIDVRDKYLQSKSTLELSNQIPTLDFEASFVKTMFNKPATAIQLAFAAIVLFSLHDWLTIAFAVVIILSGIISMNYKYFTLKFFDDGVYLQSGFAKAFSKSYFINYPSLIKIEIIDESGENNESYSQELNYTTSKTITLLYYDGKKFISKTTSCEAIALSQEKISNFITGKHVLLLFHKN